MLEYSPRGEARVEEEGIPAEPESPELWMSTSLSSYLFIFLREQTIIKGRNRDLRKGKLGILEET